MGFLSVIYGILGLGLVVIIHEAGHFFAARAVGIGVEVFSVGWGPRMTGITRRGTEYRLSWIPLGGFVKMKGETDYQNAIEQKLDKFEAEPDSFFGAAPWKRIIVALAGPLANIVFALIVFSIVNLAGTTEFSYSNRIIVADDYPELSVLGTQTSPAALAGLQTGDRIISVDGVETGNFNELSRQLGFRALDDVLLEVEREGQILELSASLMMDEQSGSGLLGIFEFIEPVVSDLADPQTSTIEIGDTILAINGMAVGNRLDVIRVLGSLPVSPGQSFAEIDVLRNGEQVTVTHPLTFSQEQEQFLLGVFFSRQAYEIRSDNLFEAIADSFSDISYVLVGTFRGIGLMFRGLNPLNVLSGPVRITMVVGEVTAASLNVGFLQGLRAFFEMLSLLSVALFFGNLLPIPVLDGGQIVIATVEILKRKPISPRAFFRYQTVGAVIVMLLIGMVLFGDLLFVIGR